MNNHFKKVAFALVIPLLFSKTVYADEATVDIGDGTQVIISSDGQDGTESYNQGSETDNTSTSNTTQHYTQEQRNAISYRNSIYNQTRSWYSEMVNMRNHQYQNFSGGFSDNITNMTISSLHKSEIAKLLNNVNNLANAGASDWYSNSYNWGNLTKPSTSLSDDGSWSELTSEEREKIREGIVKNENSNFYISQNGGTVFAFNVGAVAFFIHDFLGGQICSSSYGSENIQNGRFLQRGSIYTNPGRIAIPNVYLGTPQIHFTDNYIDNFNGYKQMAFQEGWKINRNPNNILQYTYNPNMLFGGATASLNDNVYIALLTDYHVYSVTKEHVTNIDYTSDERRWTITLNGQPVGTPLVTDNPKHELNFTEVYEQYGAGDYVVVADQLALITKANFVQYDICNYLFDAESGNLLYAEEKLVRNGYGKSILLDEETSETPEWTPTGDTFTIHVNDLGELSYDGENPGTERTE